MMQDSVFSHKIKVNSRSVRFPVIILSFNGTLSLVALLNMYSAVAQVRTTAAIQYNSFMDMYEFVATTGFILLIFIVSAVTASNISGERERQTLELTLTTQMTAFQMVMEKLMSTLSALLLLIVSGFPAMAMVSVYGDIAWGDVASLPLCYITVAFFAGNVRLCFSTLFRRSTIFAVVTYGVLVAMVTGTYFINKFTLSLSSVNINSSTAAYGFGENVVKAISGEAFYLLLLNPAATFLTILNDQVGGSAPLTKIKSYSDTTVTNFITDNWIMMSILIQLALAILMIYIAVRCAEPVKRRHKNDKKGVNHGNY